MTEFSQSIKDKLIVAIDVPTLDEARVLIRALHGSVGYFKIGLSLVPIGGFDLMRELIADGEQVFADLKLFDIHQTVHEAAARMAELGVHILTLQGDPQIVRTAVAGRTASGNTEMKLFAITILTSLDQNDVDEMGYEMSIGDLALFKARNALGSGADGVVCSGHEAAGIKAATGGKLATITPGIRSAGTGAQDQKRIMTPGQAIAAGSDHLVVGRQITKATDPKAAAEAVLAEIAVVAG